MAKKGKTQTVVNYDMGWSPTKHRGYLKIYWVGGSRTVPESSKDPTEFQILIDLLRNEKPVYWDEGKELLFSYREPAGEGE